MSKLVDANKKIEEAVVGGYKKVEDKFVDTFLKKDGETLEDAKIRIAKEQEEAKTVQETTLKSMSKYSKTTEEIQAEIQEKYGR